MRIEYLKIENFKCFEALEISLDRDVNTHIIYGINSIGKTSVLEALGIALGSLFIEMSEVEKRPIDKFEVRLANRLGKLEYQFPITLHCKANALGKNVCFQRAQNSFESGLTQKDAKEIVEISKTITNIVKDGIPTILPVVTYFSCQRLFVGTKSTSKDRKPLGRLKGYYNALNEKNIGKEIDKWLEDEENIQYIEIQNGNKAYQSKGLRLIYETLLSVFPGKYQSVYFYKPKQDDRLPSGLFFKSANGDSIPLQMMSDGYKNTYGLVLEIAWRCYLLNPFLEEKTLAQTPGCVLIDEIDLHLHPSLQLNILRILQETFPLVQFVVTTHSPLVLSSCKGEVFVIKDYQLQKKDHIYGRDSSFIIRNYMESPDKPVEIQQKINEYFSLVNENKGRSEQARELKRQLEGIADNELAEADVLESFIGL